MRNAEWQFIEEDVPTPIPQKIEEWVGGERRMRRA